MKLCLNIQYLSHYLGILGCHPLKHNGCHIYHLLYNFCILLKLHRHVTHKIAGTCCNGDVLCILCEAGSEIISNYVTTRLHASSVSWVSRY